MPGQGAHALEQLLKAARLKLSADHQHAVGAAQPEVGAQGVQGFAGKPSAAGLGPHALQGNRAQFVGYDAFQAERGGGDPLLHVQSPILWIDKASVHRFGRFGKPELTSARTNGIVKGHRKPEPRKGGA